MQSLDERAAQFAKDLQKRHKINQIANLALVTVALILASIAIICGIVWDKGTFPACLGVIVGAMFALDRAFGFGAISEYLARQMVEANIIEDRIGDTNNERVRRRINSDLINLKRSVAESLPVGKSMEAVNAFVKNYGAVENASASKRRGRRPKRRSKQKRSSKEKIASPASHE